MSDRERLTRQELSWLLTQEARGAAERLRKGVQILTNSAPPPPSRTSHVKGDRPGSDRPLTLSSSGEEEDGIESTLNVLDGAMERLAQLYGPHSARTRRGRVDLAGMLWEVAPEAKVQLSPGAGTSIFGDEAELRRMLHVLLGASTQSGVGGATAITLKRVGEEVRLGVALGPDTAPISPAERGWLSRMAIRYGGRYELDGASECLVFPAEEAEQQQEVKTLRKELEAAKLQGEAYARELAAVFTDPASESAVVAATLPPAGAEIAPPASLPALASAIAAHQIDQPDASVGGPKELETLLAFGRVADALSEDIRGVLAPLGASRIKAHEVLSSTPAGADLSREIQGALGRGAALLGLVRQLARISPDSMVESVDVAAIAREEADLARGAFAAHGVVLTIALGTEAGARLRVEGVAPALRALIAEMLDSALRSTAPGAEVRIALDGAILSVEAAGEPGTSDETRPIPRAAGAALTLAREIARAHSIALHVGDDRIVAHFKQAVG